VAILKSFSRTGRPDPVIVLGGGPASPLVTAAPGVAVPESVQGDIPHQMVAKALIHTLRAERGVMFYDQRGVGFSEPRFCPEEAANWGSRVGAEYRTRLSEVATRCGDSMRRAGFDLSQYNSAVLDRSVGTDPNSALNTRRGTGYYRVPSLKGVWYRGPFEHNGSVATLEDWFDPQRLGDCYVPTGHVGYGFKTRAVKGHRFGLSLSADDKKALVAFLKTP
jgi:pimeloyl-ACP methyl ester carboxylesterase